MNELKQEAIKKAYGEYYDKCKPDENAWCDFDSWYKFVGHKIDYDSKPNEILKCIRPKSLQGIENNNGWIRIESENDIELCDCFFITKKGNMYLGKVEIKEGDYFFIKDGVEGFAMCFVTHFYRINKPNPPIY